ncbi:Crp/Fnr family transcriptional regulator [Raoultibacter phocaeensis]|uniref:Crp/Fnr family transcriptional regulator n=1 Tax=Raoultibacter phocaeensis TaxID=2479841 RepID=UPI00111BBB79|nr:Crp/Fnr family transcriptional regulator [Raoultibacter phocaeensis]
MKDYLPILSRSPLFKGILDNEIEAMLTCLNAQTRTFEKGKYLFRVGEATTTMGMVLEGSVRIEKEDYWGNRSILAQAEPGQLFAEVYACEPELPLDVNVIAAQDCVALLMDVRRVTTMCTSACEFHTRLVRNLLASVAKRAYALTRKIEHTSRRSTREKLLSYLSDQADSAGSGTFSIPFNRQELADYLSVDRSAMSAELSNMRKEGIIDFDKNRFAICNPTELREETP